MQTPAPKHEIESQFYLVVSIHKGILKTVENDLFFSKLTLLKEMCEYPETMAPHSVYLINTVSKKNEDVSKDIAKALCGYAASNYEWDELPEELETFVVAQGFNNLFESINAELEIDAASEIKHRKSFSSPS